MEHYKVLRAFVIIAALTGITACLADVFFTYYYGHFLPGYNAFRQPMSILGSAISPYARQLSNWWIIQGSLLILFAIGFIAAFYPSRKIMAWAAILIIIYGLGEGISTGAIPVEYKNGHLTLQGYIHDLLGGIGVAAVMVLPFLLRRYFFATGQFVLYNYSLIIGLAGISFFAMFTIAKLIDTNQGIFAFKGLWQRLSSLNYYIYFITLAVLMLRKQISVFH